MSILSKTYKALLALLLPALMALTSCDAFNQDLDPCVRGLKLRFVYDFNMEFANAFPAQVDCLTLLVYDQQGNYVRTVTASRPETADENWRMTIDLPAGTYQLLAYGGMDCNDASFKFNTLPSQSTFRNLEVYLPSNLITEPKGTDLHPLFYGRAEVTVAEESTTYTEKTVYMMKDTNDIRVMLANENGDPISADDFIFTITDNNTRFNYLNNIISTESITYRPWEKGDAQIGVLPEHDDLLALVSWAEFSVSRLIEDSEARLTVYRTDGKKVLSIPLIEVLLLVKSEHFKDMTPQDFLDRQSRWNLTFFLIGDGTWAGVSIIVNDWIVRINDIDIR